MHLPIIFDTDPGIDDAVAIAATLFAPQCDLKLITTVVGNVSLEKTPATPLLRPLYRSAEEHGE